MSNPISFRDFKCKREDSEFHLYTVEEFKGVMNGVGYDDSGFQISISPFLDPGDEYICGWYISFYHAENDQYCVVAQDDHNGIDDFILYHKDINEIFDILNSLKPCFREVIVKHENNYQES